MSKIETGYTKKELPKSIGTLGMVLLAVGLVSGIISYLVDPARASFTYLTTFLFFLSFGIGSLFLVAVEYAANAVWSVPFRRISEFFSVNVLFLVILVIPLFFGMHDLFKWMNPLAVAHDKVLQAKAPYLNSTFFILRDIGIFVIWIIFYFALIRNSRKQDTVDDQSFTRINIRISAFFIVVFAFTVSLISFDWIMSMSPHWFSTIFGVYFFSDAVWVALAGLTLAAVILHQKGYLSSKLRDDHFYSLGTLMFAFTSFWGYIAFSQYMLQWYGNLPEEIVFFVNRWSGGWKYLSIILVLTHFVIPFFALISKQAKTNPRRLKFIAIWIICSEFIDIYWMVMPGMANNGYTYSFSWIDFTFPLLVVGLVIVAFKFMVKKHNLIPVGDPKLKRSLDFHL